MADRVDYQKLARIVLTARGEQDQSEFGQSLALSQSQVSRLESGRLRQMTAEMLYKLQQRFGVDLGGAAQGLPSATVSRSKGDTHNVETGGLKGKERQDLLDFFARVAKLWHRDGDVRGQLIEAVERVELRNPDTSGGRRRKA